MDNTKNLTADKIAKLQELVNVKRISDLDEFTELNSTDSSFLDNSYMVTSSYTSNNYINYKLKLRKIIQYLQDTSDSRLNDIINRFEEFVNELEYSEITQNIVPFDDSEYGTSYAYTDALTPGLVTGNVLEQYVRNTMGRILGVPNTPAYVSEAMDSISEFVDWFKGFSTNDDNYQSLLDLINNMVNVDENNNTITSGSTIYTLDIRNGKIGLYPYTSFSASVSTGLGTDSMEYGVNEDKTKNIIVTTNKDFNYTDWTTSSQNASVISTTKNNSTKLTINVKYNTANTATFSGTVTEVGGNETSKNLSASSSTTRTYRYWYLISDSETASISNLSSWTAGPLSTIGYPTNGNALVANPNGKYLFILFKHKDNPKFYVGAGTEKAPFPGATTFISENNKPYSGGPNYDIWRTTETQSGQINIIIE